ncbi:MULTISPECIES: hypothetical protein [unclassified Nostoc]|uniref:hypothetical protein n=1 Tax=unclassified Nostoc TaxID=2593658 RepID=UPI0025AA6EDC|nr:MULTISPECIES: hypothetical protein [unclassified Nostoc]MDM9584258.1 hypothetical protein [Nostoc sp. GT001]MDM9586360.1 hypothetical protein [Nostoc sp. GT001]MDZ7947908.1 hypothetical protein [Nostoc sp. EfeVER01]
MKIWKSLLIVLMIVANFAFAQPSFADRPKFSKNPDYIEVIKALNELSQTKDTQTQVESLTPEEIKKRTEELTLQKYALETGINWGQCNNQTGNTIAVYGKRPNDEDNEDAVYENGLYFLANGQSTKKNWDCDGIYLANDAKVENFTSSPNGQGQELTGPVALKILDGTQLVIKKNPDTAAIELNVPTVKVLNSKEANWFIPDISQALIDTRVPNAPSNQS